jgi:citrate synthase
LTADEAASALKVKKETIYAYVSRGRLTTRRSDDGRGSVFDAAEIERLAAGSRQGAMRAAAPEIESSLTLLTESGHYYRGQDARDLAQTHSFEQVAQLLWGVADDQAAWEPAADLVDVCRRVVDVLPSTILPVDAIKLAASTISALEPPEWNTSASVIAASARRVFATLVSALPQRSEAALGLQDEPPHSWIVPMLWSRLCERAPTGADLRLLNGAMVVLADHDLASSALIARSAARSGVNVGGIIRLGADVGSGPVKGAASLAIESFLHNIESPESVEKALTMRLRQGEPIPGFGHSQYAAGDPRATFMLDALRATAPDSTRLATVEELIRMQRQRGLPAPNAGFGIAALTYVLGMVPGAGEAIFVCARSAGWIAHAIEEYSASPPPRQRSRYVGPAPGSRG